MKAHFSEDALLTGTLESTNEPYSIARIAPASNFAKATIGNMAPTIAVSCLPTCTDRVDNCHPDNSHVIPALIRRFHEAKISALSAGNQN